MIQKLKKLKFFSIEKLGPHSSYCKKVVVLFPLFPVHDVFPAAQLKGPLVVSKKVSSVRGNPSPVRACCVVVLTRIVNKMSRVVPSRGL